VTVHFVELAKDYNKIFGFKWAPGFTTDPQFAIGPNANGQTTTSATSFSAVISSLFPKLQSAQNAGFARVLRQGTLIVRSGQPAKLNETTDMPYTIAGPNGQQNTATSKVGLEVDVTPQILGSSEDIQMDLKMNQIDPVGKAVGNGPVATTNHAVETKLYVKSGESAAVAGVTSQNISTDFNKEPMTTGMPNTQTDTLFDLQRSKNYQKKKTQFVIFVTPQIEENASDGTEDLKKSLRIRVQ
jgi:pilus assembly protein CpaC